MPPLSDLALHSKNRVTAPLKGRSVPPQFRYLGSSYASQHAKFPPHSILASVSLFPSLPSFPLSMTRKLPVSRRVSVQAGRNFSYLVVELLCRLNGLQTVSHKLN